MSSNVTATDAPSSAQAPPASSEAPLSASQPPPASSAPPASTPTPETSAAPPPETSSQAPPATSPASPASSPAPPSTTAAPAPVDTSVVTASSAPPTTAVQTSIITVTPSATREGEKPSVIVITSIISNTNAAQPTGNVGASSRTGSSNPSSTNQTELQNAQKENSSGLGSGGKTAIAVVIPVVVVALLVLGGIFFWRKRKQRKTAEDERRKEVEEYGFNPNHDPTLPAVGGLQMAEDDSGYRGWGNTATSSNRKASTTLTSGMTYSDSNSNPGGYANPHSPTNGAYSDVHSNDPLVDGRRETLDSDGIGALGVVNGAGATNSAANNAAGVHRGPSNASSSYSAANHSDNSGDYPGMATSHPQEFYNNADYYQSAGPYGAGNDPYGGAGQQPIIRDVSARRNTRIENPSVFPQQGNSGIAQNF